VGAEAGNIIFIIWRESVEALLVIGILSAWLAHQSDAKVRRRGRVFLWAGVTTGLLIAIGLGAALLGASSMLPEDAQVIFQTSAVFIAAALIVQMVLWMRKRGRTLKRDLEQNLTNAAVRANWWGVFVLAMVAVAREGSETVIFLYGALSAVQSTSFAVPAMAASAGFALALGSYLLLQIGGRLLSWRLFFRVTEVMLLCLGAALLLTGVDNLVGLDVLPQLSGKLWDTSALLPDESTIGGIVAALTGYRARPDLTEIIAFTAYWAAIACMMWWPSRVKLQPA
jgi:high-affinity iron transporter